MSDINQFRPSKSITAIIAADPPATAAVMSLFDGSETPAFFNKKSILSGAVTAATYKTVLSVSGAGVITYLGARTKNATSKVAGLRVTIDGVVVYNVQTANFAQSNRVLQAIGHLSRGSTGGTMAIAHDNVTFNYSLVVELYSSLTETDQAELLITYNLY